MNKKLISYLNSLSVQDVRRILSEHSREASPRAYSFWSRIFSAKRSGWNDQAASAFASQAEKLGDSIIVGSVPKDLFQGQDPATRFNTPNIPMSSVDDYINLGQKVVKEPVEKSTQEMLPEVVVEYQPNYQKRTEPSRASEIGPNGEQPARAEFISKQGEKLSTPPQNDSQTPSASKRETTNMDELPSVKSKAPDPFADAMEQLKATGLKSFERSIQEWEATKNANAESFRAQDLSRRENLNNFLNDFKDVLGPIRDTIGFIEARKDEKRAQRLVDQSLRETPTAPLVRGENRILSNLIRNSQIAYSNPQQFIQPYMDQINLGYQQDLARGQEMAGGQAGNAMALSQAAAIRRNQAAQQGAGMAADVFREGLSTTGALVGQQMQDDTWRDQQNIDLYKTALNTNLEFQRQAGLGLAMSRQRSIQQRNNMIDGILNSPAFDVDTYMTYTRNNLINPPTI